MKRLPKLFKPRLPLGIILLMMGSFSCTIEERLENKEERLLGTWEIEKAFYQDDNDLFRDNLTDEFEGDLLDFYDDFTVVYDDAQTREIFFGDWVLHAYRDYYDDDSDVDFLLDMEFYDDRDDFAFAWFSHVTRLSWEKLHIRVQDRQGVYTFRLRKR